MLPMILRLRIVDDEHKINLYFPLIFIYIIAIPFYILGVIFYLLLFLYPSKTVKQRIYLLIFLKSPQIMAAAIGTEVSVYSDDSKVYLYIK